MRPWLEPPEIEIPAALLQLADGQPLTAAVLIRRGYAAPAAARAFLDPACYASAAPEEFPSLPQAVERLWRAVRRREHILVWGDFDVDGQTATTLLVQSLRQLGGRISYHIPVRAQESHGVGLPALRRLLDAPDPPAVLLTCDTGIAAHPAAALARERQVDLIITDHHELPPDQGLPPALAVVTPRRLPAAHPLAGLPGVGVAYKLAEALYRQASDPAGVEQYLDLAALGIVADVAPLTGETRYLLQRGLEHLRQPQRLGLLALYERAGLKAASGLPTVHITEEQIGFILAPRLNALGRLADANLAVELLSTRERGRARLLALELEGLNTRRQLLTAQVLQAALRQIEQEPALREAEALVLAHADWPAGVIGIVASRLVELFGKPAALIAAPFGQPARGSARSIEGLDITAAIAAQSDLLDGFGGHRMAAGFSLSAENIPAFRRGLARAVAAQRAASNADLQALPLDGDLPWADITLELAESLERLAPFGAGNPPLALVSRSLQLKRHSSFGRQDEHLNLTVEDENGLARRVTWWGGGELLSANPLPQGRFDLAFTLRATDYRGQRALQLAWLDARPTPGGSALHSVKQTPQLEDYRHTSHPWPILQRLLDEAPAGQVQVWAEAEAATRLARQMAGDLARDRLRLSASEMLVIWSAPPALAELRAALSIVQPRRVAVFAIDPQMDQSTAFLQRLGGLLKYALARRSGRVSLANLAAATAQREWTVRLGLEWWAAKERLALLPGAPDELIVARPDPTIPEISGGFDSAALSALEEQIALLLDETRAFRAYFLRHKPLSLPEF